ncbi:hypothetical protein Hamer_G013522 [Homarus americanus]|uniref:Uncharacterized protein n=1 Tax=Homarus americanus TaxID=6706 RepID=A0A8J5K9C7_HOMAM|nr:hypothetical protein Hamer_G013522 [Homarus americanus]
MTPATLCNIVLNCFLKLLGRGFVDSGFRDHPNYPEFPVCTLTSLLSDGCNSVVGSLDGVDPGVCSPEYQDHHQRSSCCLRYTVYSGSED